MDVRSYLRHPWTCAQRAPSVSTHSRVASSLSLLHHPPSPLPTICLLRCPSTSPYPFKFPSSCHHHTCTALPSTYPPLRLLFPSVLLPSPLWSLLTSMHDANILCLQISTCRGPCSFREDRPSTSFNATSSSVTTTHLRP
jgi:hypothetical protein